MHIRVIPTIGQLEAALDMGGSFQRRSSVQREGGSIWTKDGKTVQAAPIQNNDETVPLEIAAEAHKEYCKQYGAAQTLPQINERGGFGVAELAIMLLSRIRHLEKRIYQLRGQHRG